MKYIIIFTKKDCWGSITKLLAVKKEKKKKHCKSNENQPITYREDPYKRTFKKF